MNLRRCWLALAIAGSGLMVSACAAASAALPSTYKGTMTSGCAPHDAPSTVLQLESDDGAALVSFNLWPSAGMVPPVTVEFDAQHAIGQGTYCTGPEACEPAVWGEVTLDRPGSSPRVTGEWSMGMSDGRIYRGRLSVDWLAIQALCG